MNKIEAYRKIYVFIKLRGYTYTVEDVVEDYKDRYCRSFYVCDTMKDVIENCKAAAHHLSLKGMPKSPEKIEMPKFEVEVEIIETCRKRVTLVVDPFKDAVEGETIMRPGAMAEIIATKRYYEEEIVLDSQDFSDVDIEHISVKELEVE